MTVWDGHGGEEGREQASVSHENITRFLKRGLVTARLASARAEHGALSMLPGGWQGRKIIFAADREI